MPQAHFIISGRVQGVGFRVFVRALGEEMDVDGAVWNTRSGAVEAIASHRESALLDEFAERLKNGPGYVANIVRSEVAGAHLGPGFEIRPTV